MKGFYSPGVRNTIGVIITPPQEGSNIKAGLLTTERGQGREGGGVGMILPIIKVRLMMMMMSTMMMMMMMKILTLMIMIIMMIKR